MNFLKEATDTLLKSFRAFMEDNGFQYSAAVSFYTLFSIAPIVMIAVYTAGIFVGNESVMRELTGFLNETIGQQSSEAVMLLVETIQTENQSVLYLIISVGFLIVSATTVFVQFQDSFNRIFKVMIKSEVGVWKLLIDRFMAFGMIVLLGIAMITSLVLDTLLVSSFDLLSTHFESVNLVLTVIGSNLLTIAMIFVAILSMFYILPDVKVQWRALIYGSLVTTLLLVIGKFGVGMIIGNSPLNQLSGASSSVIILMLWVYYSSIIIFFGIELVKALAERNDREIQAGRFARKFKVVDYAPNNKKTSTE
ncbi:MAG: YihY/virulence factor BrkB family protein [Gracilimonas sp.]|uniref:YihY/virulence factor BrkB family protein n=1 Tax=Gracilimonas sp. TaxID=1974203 RepID=UPI0019BA0B72|nr:YihY/virulence factor BrkB family protein [Gracilimonas sp.]MBD3616953.1 YihY/virulence factor BrkB family protein [Gracilimonas sp.]